MPERRDARMLTVPSDNYGTRLGTHKPGPETNPRPVVLKLTLILKLTLGPSTVVVSLVGVARRC